MPVEGTRFGRQGQQHASFSGRYSLSPYTWTRSLENGVQLDHAARLCAARSLA